MRNYVRLHAYNFDISLDYRSDAVLEHLTVAAYKEHNSDPYLFGFS